MSNWVSLFLIFLGLVFIFVSLIGINDFGFLAGFCLGSGIVLFKEGEQKDE